MKQLKTPTKILTGISLLFLLVFGAYAQNDKAKRPSPPAQAKATVDGVDITIDYSQPAVKGRTIWGDLVPYGKVWRTGANEASWIEVSADVEIDGQTLPKGKYGLFTIPGEDEWTIIFNKTWNQWGAYDYDSEKDVLRTQVTPIGTDEVVEKFTIDINDDGVVTMSWASLAIQLDIDKS